MINKNISVHFGQKCLIFYSKVLLEPTIFVTMATYWVPDLHDEKDFSDHFKHSILFTANGASSA